MNTDAYTRAMVDYRGWTYGRLSRRYREIECCAFTALVLEDALAWPRDDQWWADMMIRAPEHPLSPVLATADRLTTAPCLPNSGPDRPRLGMWSLIQGWRKDGTGHQLLWRAHDHDAWQGWVVESSSKRGIGPCVRGLQGQVGLSKVIDGLGNVTHVPEPLDFGELVADFDAGLAWVELPEVP